MQNSGCGSSSNPDDAPATAGQQCTAGQQQRVCMRLPYECGNQQQKRQATQVCRRTYGGCARPTDMQAVSDKVDSYDDTVTAMYHAMRSNCLQASREATKTGHVQENN
jgi:hypothetical protein